MSQEPAKDPNWLINETNELTEAEAQRATQRDFGFDRTKPPINLAIFDLIIDDTRKWFGGADIRLDALVVTPGSEEDQLYQAKTDFFPRVRDGERLPIDPTTGLAVYTGWPAYFLDLAIVVSRGDSGQKSITTLLAESADQLGTLLGKVAELTAIAPQAAAIPAAAAAAFKLSSSILQLIDRATGNSSIGLYRATWYEVRHNFGIGLHPDDGTRFVARDFQFRYEIFQ